MQTGERMLVQLIEEVKLPLLSKDKVSLSVLTGRYTSENNVASLTIKDIDNEVLLQTGQAQMLEGDNIEQSVILGDTVIGSVQMTLRKTSNGEIIASQWMFILGSFITHLLIWLLYGYIARPTRAQLAALSREVQDYLIHQKRIPATQHLPSTAGLDTDNEQTQSGGSIHEALGQYIKSHQEGGEHADVQSAETQTQAGVNINAALDANSSDNVESSINNANANANSNAQGATEDSDAANDTQAGALTSNKPKALAANRPLDVASVQIHFHDPNLLLNTLAFEKSTPYFALCTQLLQRTIDELLKQPILFGIKLNNKPVFDENGATVEFIGTTSHSKAGLAAMMLAKAYVMLNQVTYIKHRELQRFALEVMVGVSDKESSDKLEQLMVNNAKANDVLTLLPVEGIKQLRGLIQLSSLKNPTTVYERDCAYLDGVSDSMMQRLIDVRDAVLLSALSAN
nr:hypothetical protein [Psychrobacter sp. FDAARGOS_221]